MNIINDLSKLPSVVNNYMHDLRNVKVQADRERFRNNVRRIGRVIGLELSKSLRYEKREISTPLAKLDQTVLSSRLVVVTVLRAGLPLHEGLLDVFPEAENGFISAYRKHTGSSFSIDVGYVACPNPNGKVLILSDPMLATGQSFIAAWQALLEYGTPEKVVLAAVIASAEGVKYIQKHAPSEFELWVGVIDPELNEKKYIVPGLGDAGDLSFGEKLQS